MMNPEVIAVALADINRLAIAKRGEGPHYTSQDDLKYCSICNTALQRHVKLMDQDVITGCLCQCGIDKWNAEREKERQELYQQFIDNLRKKGLTDPAYLEARFEDDDSPDSSAGFTCRRYVERWKQMKEQNVGIMFTGSVGTGKSYYACCIANALIEKGVSVLVTSFPRILNQIFDSRDKQAEIDRLQEYDLLVIDDLGAERGTDYTMEQIFSVIDGRSRAKKPLIVTTNLSPEAMKSVKDIAQQRIFDRITDMTPLQVKLTGDSRRQTNAVDKRKAALKLLMEDLA